MSMNTNNPIDNFLAEIEAQEANSFFTTEEPKQIQPAPAQEITPVAEQKPIETPPPVQEPEPQAVEEPEKSPAEPKKAAAPVQETLMGDEGFEAALKKSKAQSDERLIGNLAEKPPIFKYASNSDPITDKDITFEDLRKQYVTDFPELEEEKNISWSVTYGKCVESVAKPDKELVYAVKEKIEKSDKFLDALKKAKKDTDKNPECIVKPTVRAQKKGEALAMPEYKGFFTNYNEAVKSPKTIALVPARDGKIYEIRKTPIGIFQSPARVIGEFADLAPSFKARLPKIPMFLLYQIISFFRMISDEFKLEALVHIVYDTATDKYNVKIPKQRLTKISVDSVLEEYPESVIHVMDIHSHNTMAARFSETDNQDEKATRLYAVIGRLDKEIPDMALRASNGGKFIKINLSDVFDFEATYPEAWTDEINHAMAEALCEQEQQIGGDKPAYL